LSAGDLKREGGGYDGAAGGRQERGRPELRLRIKNVDCGATSASGSIDAASEEEKSGGESVTGGQGGGGSG
jgi:hypothetical protein